MVDLKELKESQAQAREQIKQCFDDNEATLPSGNTYTFTKLNHKRRLKVFTRFQLLEKHELMFFDSPDFEVVEKIVEESVLFDGMQLSKLDGHWDRHPQDFFMFYKTAMGVISYPFLSGAN